jgi:hypothetical protein
MLPSHPLPSKTPRLNICLRKLETKENCIPSRLQSLRPSVSQGHHAHSKMVGANLFVVEPLPKGQQVCTYKYS